MSTMLKITSTMYNKGVQNYNYFVKEGIIEVRNGRLRYRADDDEWHPVEAFLYEYGNGVIAGATLRVWSPYIEDWVNAEVFIPTADVD